jgi:exosome complex component RRP46
MWTKIVRVELFCIDTLLQLLACAVNAACLALINSGIAMKFLVAAVSCMIDREDNILIDPNSKQLKV